MAQSAEQQRARRSVKRAAEAELNTGRGQRKPRGKAPTGCYWDPRPGEAEGVWRDLDTHEKFVRIHADGTSAELMVPRANRNDITGDYEK